MSTIGGIQMIKPFRCVNAPKNKFSVAEDEMLKNLVRKYGENEWDLISQVLGTKNSRQCHDRWVYNLSPKVNKKPFTEEEDQKLLDLVENLGPHWVQISKRMPGRTDTQIKNRYKVLKRRVNSPQQDYISDFSPIAEKPSVNIIKANESTNSSHIDQMFAALDHFFEVNSISFLEDPFSVFD